MRLQFLLPAALLATGIAAHADIIPYLTASPTATVYNGQSGYLYTYGAGLATNSQLDATTNGAPLQFFTIYDFGPGTITATSGLISSVFTHSQNLTDSPVASQTVPTDNASIANVRFTYTGSTTITGASLGAAADNLGTFTLFSTFGPNLHTGNSYDGQTYKTSNDTIQGNVGFVSAPLLVTTPEPSSLALLGTGMLGVVGLIKRRTRA